MDTATSDLEPSLAAAGPGLMLVGEREEDDNVVGAYAYDLTRRTYTSGSVYRPPNCGIVIGPQL